MSANEIIEDIMDNGVDLYETGHLYNRLVDLKEAVAELQSKLDEIEKQEPVVWLTEFKGNDPYRVMKHAIDYPNAKSSNPKFWTDAFPVFTNVKKS